MLLHGQNIKKNNSKWTKMPDQPYKILKTGGSGR